MPAPERLGPGWANWPAFCVTFPGSSRGEDHPDSNQQREVVIEAMADLEAIQFEHYEFIQHLGTGGMAEVYRVRQRHAFGREVALKVIKRGLAEDPLFRERFLREGQATARLSHPHILQLIELGQEHGPDGERLFLVMPYVQDGTLRDLLAMMDGPLPIETISTLFPQLCDAVQYAHDQGVVHRDIKPSNILLLHEWHVLLADFGIALDTEDIRLTSTGVGLGTPEYTAPEQAMGRADRRSDIYSLGIVLFEMLTGRVPFTGGTPFEVLFKQTTAPVPRLRTVNPDLPKQLNRLDAVIQKALAKEPDERFQTARTLSEAFQTALASPPTEDVENPTPVVVSLDSSAAEDWSPPHGFFPLPADAAEVAGAQAGRRSKAAPGTTGDSLGDQPTVPALAPGGLRQGAGASAGEARAERRRLSVLGVVALLAILLLGSAVVILGYDLIHTLGDNLPGAAPTIQHTAGPQGSATAAPTQTSQPRPTSTAEPTVSPSPSPTSSPTAAPTSNPTPTPTLPLPTPTGG